MLTTIAETCLSCGQGIWYCPAARPQDKALLGSNLSAGQGDRAERTGLLRRTCPSLSFEGLPYRRFQGFFEIEPESISFSRNEPRKAAATEVSCDHLLVIFPARRHTNQAYTGISKKAIDERIAFTAFLAAMRAIIQFDARDNPRRLGATDDKINVLLGNAVRVTEFPIPVRAGDNVGETDLARDSIAIRDYRREGPEERGLVLGQQETSRHEDTAS